MWKYPRNRYLRRYVIQWLLLLKNNFFIKQSIFVLLPLESSKISLQVSDFRTFRRPSDLQGTSPGRRVQAGCFLSQFSQLKSPKIVANHGSFIPLKYSLTDLITQHLQENNLLFYDLWSIYHPRALSRNSNKKVNLLVFFKKCKF